MEFTRFDFYALRFDQSESCGEMNDAECGQFLLLLIKAWLGGKGASLPTDPKLLAKYARCKEVSPLVLCHWEEKDGRLYNETLSKEWAEVVTRYDESVREGRNGGSSKSEAKVAAARENGKLGGRPPNSRPPSVGNPTNPSSNRTEPFQTESIQTVAGRISDSVSAQQKPVDDSFSAMVQRGSSSVGSVSVDERRGVADLFGVIAGVDGLADDEDVSAILKTPMTSALRFAHLMIWAYKKSNFWPHHLSNAKSFIENYEKIEEQYEKYNEKVKPKARLETLFPTLGKLYAFYKENS